MSKTPITSDAPDLGHLVAAAARVTVAEMRDPDGSVAMVTKSLRLPSALAARAENAGHPDGFSGVVREALTEWLARHSGAQAEADDARAALAVLARVVGNLEHRPTA